VNERPTPETDAVTLDITVHQGDCELKRKYYPDGNGDYVEADFARNLERQRDEARERVAFLNHAIAKRGQEIEQTCGKALGYPWFKNDQKNFPGATEADGVCAGEHVPETIVSELAGKHQKAIAQRDELLAALEAIKRRVPIMGSKGDYREGQLHALEACSEVANAAIAAVKGGGK